MSAPRIAEAAHPRGRPLRRFATREALYRTARREARMSLGRSQFVWHDRVLPVGVPLGVLVGAAVWRDDRRRGGAGWPPALGAALVTVAMSGVAGLLEWRRFVRAYHREVGRDL